MRITSKMSVKFYFVFSVVTCRPRWPTHEHRDDAWWPCMMGYVYNILKYTLVWIHTFSVEEKTRHDMFSNHTECFCSTLWIKTIKKHKIQDKRAEQRLKTDTRLISVLSPWSGYIGADGVRFTPGRSLCVLYLFWLTLHRLARNCINLLLLH